MVYWMNAIMLPTCMAPHPPDGSTQTIRTEMPFIISIMMGIMRAIMRLTNRWVQSDGCWPHQNVVLHAFGIESTDDKHPSQALTGYQIEPVHKLLNDFESGYRNKEQYQNQG